MMGKVQNVATKLVDAEFTGFWRRVFVGGTEEGGISPGHFFPIVDNQQDT
jgi:hypothetical protein